MTPKKKKKKTRYIQTWVKFREDIVKKEEKNNKKKMKMCIEGREYHDSRSHIMDICSLIVNVSLLYFNSVR